MFRSHFERCLAPLIPLICHSTNARSRRVGKAAGCFENLSARLLADHLLQLPHQPRIWVRTDYRSEQVVGTFGIGDPGQLGTAQIDDVAGVTRAHSADTDDSDPDRHVRNSGGRSPSSGPGRTPGPTPMTVWSQSMS